MKKVFIMMILVVMVAVFAGCKPERKDECIDEKTININITYDKVITYWRDMTIDGICDEIGLK